MSRVRTLRQVLLVVMALAPALAGAGVPAPRVAVTASPGIGTPSATAAKAAADAARAAGADAVAADEVARTVRLPRGGLACAGDAACAVATCAAVRADYVLGASVADAETGWRVELRLRDGKRGAVRGQASEVVARDERAVRESAARLAQRLVAPLFYARGELPPPPGSMLAPAVPPPPPPALALRPAGPPAVDAIAVPAPASASGRRTFGNVLIGTGAALVIGGVASGALGWSAWNDANASLARGDLGRFSSARSASRTLGWTAAALGGAGGVALATGAWLRLGARPAPVSVALEPGGASARVAVAF